MIDFDVKNCHELIGGLNFQLINNFTNSNSLKLTNIDYSDSISCSEYAFSIIEDIFSSSYSLEEKMYYHTGIHTHSLNELEIIINKIIALELYLNEKKIPYFIYKKEELIENVSSIESIRNGCIRLAWSTEEMRDELKRNIQKESYRAKLLDFLHNIKFFLLNNKKNLNSKGIYVIGI